MMAEAEATERTWWNRYADLEGHIWNYNRFIGWVIRRSYLKEMVEVLYHPEGRVLDVGCGDGWVSLLLAQAGMQVEGIDLAEAQVDLARSRAQRMGVANVTFRCASTDDLAGSMSYDGVVIHATLHHLSRRQQQRLFYQLDGLLKPGGRVYMYEPVAAVSPRPLIASTLDRGIGIVMKCLRGLSRALRLIDEDIRLAIKDGWTMRSPKESPIVLSELAATLPETLRLCQVKYWHAFSISYANFCMELKPSWQALFSPGTIPFYLLDKLIFRLGIGKHLLSWPMAAIQLEKA